MPRSPEQKPIPEISTPIPALRKLFPEYSEEQLRKNAISLEKLTPKPFDVNHPFVMMRASASVLAGYWVNKEQMIPLEDNSSGGLLKKTGSIVLFLDSDSFSSGSLWLEQNIPFLKPETKIWIVEKKYSNEFPLLEERQIRLDILESWGLVTKKVLINSRTEDCYWYARTAKDWKTDGVDITDKTYFKKILNETRREFKEEGWEIDTSEIEEICRHARYIPGSLEQLKLGFGIKLKAECGCSWHITSDGSLMRLRQCQEDCEGEPIKPSLDPLQKRNEPQSLMLIGENIPSSLAGRKLVCWDCGSELFYDRRIIKQSGDYKQIVSICKCPNCGTVSERNLKTRKDLMVYSSKTEEKK